MSKTTGRPVIERVARAIADCMHPGHDCWTSYVRAAHAAIEAMHEPPHPPTPVTPHPMQPVIRTPGGVVHFRPNAIIEYLFDIGALNLNEIAVLAGRGYFADDDRMQLAQLLGYSIEGYGDLSYASAESVARAGQAAEGLA